MTGRITGTGSWVPEHILDNNALSNMVDTNDQWIRERTGVERRHIVWQETTARMAAKAAQSALEQAQVDPEEVDLILVATISGNEILPCTACSVQEMLGAVRATCFDLNSACTGFLFALNTAQAYLNSGIYRNALVIGAESLSNLTNWKDRGTCILFGDGAGAVFLEADEKSRYAQITHSEGKKGRALTCSSRNQKQYVEHPDAQETYMEMDGREVFKFAVSCVPQVIRELLEKEKLSGEEIRFYILHQANIRIIQSVAKRLGEAEEKFPVNIQEYGNTSGASVPILLDELNRKGCFKAGNKLVLAAFGAGLSYGASLLEWK